MSQKIYIIAGNYDQYKKWVWERGLYGNKDFVFVAAPDAFRGIEDPGGRFIGTWYERPDAFDILMQLRVCSRQRNEAIEKALVAWTEYNMKKAVNK
jgi:hypothetical protein